MHRSTLGCLTIVTIFAAYMFSVSGIFPRFSNYPSSKLFNKLKCPKEYPDFLNTGAENEEPLKNSKLVGLKIIIRHGHRKGRKIKKFENDKNCDIKNNTSALVQDHQVWISISK